MKILLFYHSLLSDWNHGNAHFLRGTVKELLSRGHDVTVFEPQNSWSLENLVKDHGKQPLKEFEKYYPGLKSVSYNPTKPIEEDVFIGADLVLVHEWNDHALVSQIGRIKIKYSFKLIFHDTHHRAVSDEAGIAKYDFSNYDGALVFGDIIQKIYQQKKWISKVWTWHEAADADLFHPINGEKKGDLVWIGNWGDNERKDELNEFLIKPVKELGLKAKVYGVRYPDEALKALKNAGIEYGGWLPNYKVPEVFSEYKLTIHVPRGPYVKMLPGIPTIRPFEAMACGIPLISAPWADTENLFTTGKDYLSVKNGREMTESIKYLLSDTEAANKLAAHGRKTILARHTCAHRVDELENVAAALGIKDNVNSLKNKTIQI
ncbi:MAG TPA: glycosyltransferase [Flavobacterium sp.]|jgi:spore maturation protein CgeB